MTHTHHTAMPPKSAAALLTIALFCLLPLLAAAQAQARDIDVREAAALLRNPPYGLIIVDVRTPEEFRQGHLPGAENMDFFGGPFDAQIRTLPKDAPVLLYCRTGNRSAAARDSMEKAGLTNILHMHEGITAWQKAGLPLEK